MRVARITRDVMSMCRNDLYEKSKTPPFDFAQGRPCRTKHDKGGAPSIPKLHLSRACQDQRHVVWLLLVADPVVHGHGDDLADLRQREITVLAHQFDQALLAKLAEIILGLSDAIAVSEEDFAGNHLDRVLLVSHAVEEADHGAASFESAHGAVFSDQNRRQVASVAVGEGARAAIVDSDEYGSVFLRRGACAELMVAKAEQRSGRGFNARTPGGH